MNSDEEKALIKKYIIIGILLLILLAGIIGGSLAYWKNKHMPPTIKESLSFGSMSDKFLPR